ncbi:LysE family translocator [Streptomonospora sp. PA3]|uniref:LysE family translocator n=1 Tax=Streptomonospora sp. PA3 TaxID=2607326 RepID=UPI001642CD97|nr:LysE family translocator [Streptomonospora sp. PA3]
MPKSGRPVVEWWAFAVLLWITLVVPGPDFVVIAQAAVSGTVHGVRAAAGVVAGLCLHGVVALTGLGAVLASSPELMGPLRLVGGGVLVWFGVGLLRSPVAPEDDREEGTGGSGRCFLRGLAVNVLNPKALLFFAAVLPQFVSAERAVLPQVAVLGATVVASAALWWTLVVAAIRTIPLPRGGAAGRVATRVGGAVFVAFGAALALQAW